MSAYSDDSRVSDWRSSKGSGQLAYKVLNDLWGAPFSEEKQQPMSATGAFLGLDYELAAALQDGAVAFFVKERLVKKAQDMVATVFQTRSFRAGAASKLYMACSVSWSSACLDE